MLDTIINGESDRRRKEIDMLSMELIMYSKPDVFTGSDSAEIRYDKQFEKMCLTLSQHLNIDPKMFTVLEFYNAYEHLVEILKDKGKALKKKYK
ncbi:MAG: hypothetical protein NC344_06895 [Bacteroidales bacterium]|nr:hypothetical protein [Bacteroidales bacterium]MCM1147544.1 hypothetical protein [Bacteroidales bacterium]MCM1206334.1 hypothetical protein [Bacillota bacterium]MCM1511238.1 hypothetical protein [Clostridium sp.]